MSHFNTSLLYFSTDQSVRFKVEVCYRFIVDDTRTLVRSSTVTEVKTPERTPCAGDLRSGGASSLNASKTREIWREIDWGNAER